MNFLSILLESKKDDFVKKYSNIFSKDEIEKILSAVKPKYLDWAAKVINKINFEESLNNLVTILKDFELYSTNFSKTDINQYKSSDELLEEIKKYKNRSKRNYQKTEGNVVVYEDDEFLVVNPQTYEGSCYYGSGTKWCTTDRLTFENYNDDSKLFYFLNKKKSSKDNLYKVALLYKFNGTHTFYDSKDNTLNDGWMQDSEKLYNIMDTITEYIESEYSEQIAIWKSQELKEKEIRRISALRNQRKLQYLKLQADERRSKGEWLLDDDCPEVGLKANALFNYLVRSNNIKTLTKEDIFEIDRITNQIDEINKSKDKEFNPDVIEKLEELEQRLSEIRDDKYDVYDLVPEGNHYQMTTFIILSDAKSELEWGVGDENETEASAREYVENLIEDIGYEGFEQSFVRRFIDKDSVVESMYDWYREDYYSNPEVYLTDDLRKLSEKQEERILINKDNIDKIKEKIDKMNRVLEILQSDVERNQMERNITNLEEMLSDLKDEIEEITDNPEGDFSDDDIEEALVSRVEDEDPIYWLSEFEVDYKNYINKEDFISGVISEDGYGILSPWDGNYDEIKINNKYYYIVRIN